MNPGFVKSAAITTTVAVLISGCAADGSGMTETGRGAAIGTAAGAAAGALIGSFGASAVLLFGANDSPLSQPRNLVGGHLVSATVAVIIVALMGSTPLAMALGVGLAIFVMNLTMKTRVGL